MLFVTSILNEAQNGGLECSYSGTNTIYDLYDDPVDSSGGNIILEEGYKKEYNNKRVSPNQAGPHTEDANKLQAKIERQTQQSKENNRVAKATMPKKR